MDDTKKKITGGIPALRGFRKQFLHTLRRIIEAGDEIIYPENLEDFAAHDASGRLIEVVQVKDHSDPLTFSELHTFFQNCSKIAKKHQNVKFIIASYGNLGPELKKCIGSDESILKKNKKFSSTDILSVFRRLVYQPLKEENEIDVIKKYLSEYPLTAGDPYTAFDILMQDLYRGAEKGKAYTRQLLDERIQHIGEYLVERESHHREWGITIIPLLFQGIQNRKELQEGFYEGISVNWMHIAANLDILRNQHLKSIAEGFKNTNIVVMHGASGQGKSALAYRYLHDYCSSASRYEIRDLSTPKRVLEVTTALAGYGVPLTFYVDATHKDKGLSEFLRRINELQHVNCLITIREEDWRLTGITTAEIQFTDLELTFNRQEAQEIYSLWTLDKGSTFPDFEQAWAKFSEEGPLLEFIHLLTHTETLHERLKKQYNRIVDEIDCNQRPKSDLELIEHVAAAGACGARIDLSRLSSSHTQLRSVARLEKEYLLRLSSDKKYLIGLHPIRSKILTSIIIDPVLRPWSTFAINCLALINDEDMEVFLLNCFLSHPEATEIIIKYLNNIKVVSWTAAGGIARALLWEGIREYIQNNKSLIEQAYDRAGDGWWALLDFDFLGILNSESRNSDIIDLLPGEGRKQAENWREQQTVKTKIFSRIDDWLRELRLPMIPAFENERDWQEFGQVAYWMGFRKINNGLYEHVDFKVLKQAIHSLSLESLGDLIYGLWHALSNQEFFIAWYKEVRPLLLDRYRKEKNTPYIEEKDKEVIRAHFIVSFNPEEDENRAKSKDDETNLFHRMARQHVGLLAQLFPGFNGYGCQGYGHQVFDFEIHDDTTKTQIAAWALTPNWVIQINKTARILANHLFRPITWRDYCKKIYSIRVDMVLCLDELRKNIAKHFRSKKSVQQLVEFPNTQNWDQCNDQLKKISGFPVEAIDYWGYTDESSDDGHGENQSNTNNKFTIKSYLRRYKEYLEVKNKFFSGLSNYFYQSPGIMVAHSYLGKSKKPQEHLKIQQIIQESNLNIDRPFLPGFNLAESLKALPRFQLFYRKHFSSLSDIEKLSRLEQEESETLFGLWCLWYFFVTNPKRHMDMPGRTAQTLLKQKMDAVRKSFKDALKKISTDPLKFYWLDDKLQFEEKPALWILVDGTNPLEVYTQTEFIFTNLKQSMGEIKLNSLEYYGLDFLWQNIIIIPACRGRLVDELSWVIPIHRFSTPSTDELSNFNLIPRQIDREALIRLGLDFWEPELLQDAKMFFQSASNLQIHLQHLIKVGDLPDLDEIGIQIIQSYFDKLKDDHSKNLQKLIDMSEALLSLHKNLYEINPEEPAAEYLHLAIQQMLEISDKLVPKGFDKGPICLSMEALKEWQEQVSSIQGELFMIYLLWCGFVIHHVHLGPGGQ